MEGRSGVDQAAAAEAAKQKEQARVSILEKILSQEARERRTECLTLKFHFNLRFYKSIKNFYSETRKGEVFGGLAD